MNGDPFNWIWKRFKERLGGARVGPDDFGRRLILTVPEAMSGQMAHGQIGPYQPDNREKRHEFSQHIGC